MISNVFTEVKDERLSFEQIQEFNTTATTSITTC